MSIIIDRRDNDKKKNLSNKLRFLRKFKNRLKDKSKDSITGKNKNYKFTGGNNISLPHFSPLKLPTNKYIWFGNTMYTRGDKIPFRGSQSSPGGAGNSGGDLIIDVNEKELYDIIFSDLELPDIRKTTQSNQKVLRYQKLGISNVGIPAHLDMLRTFKKGLGRYWSLRASLEKKLKECTDEDEKERLQKQINSLLVLDDVDLQYRYYGPVMDTQSAVVMFVIMDISGSMVESRKRKGKAFASLLYQFLKGIGKDIELVFIAHHTMAYELSEEEFFSASETGGTLISEALTLAKDIMDKRYDNENYNIFVTQISDGDNWAHDNIICTTTLHEMLPMIQHYYYVNVKESPVPVALYEQELELLQEIHNNLHITHVQSEESVITDFKKTFKKRK